MRPQERRTYVPQGWTKAYEFSLADLRAGATMIDSLLQQVADEKRCKPDALDAASVPWEFIHGTCVD